jgi:hypothetical protein
LTGAPAASDPAFNAPNAIVRLFQKIRYRNLLPPLSLPHFLALEIAQSELSCAADENRNHNASVIGTLARSVAGSARSSSDIDLGSSSIASIHPKRAWVGSPAATQGFRARMMGGGSRFEFAYLRLDGSDGACLTTFG